MQGWQRQQWKLPYMKIFDRSDIHPFHCCGHHIDSLAYFLPLFCLSSRVELLQLCVSCIACSVLTVSPSTQLQPPLHHGNSTSPCRWLNVAPFSLSLTQTHTHIFTRSNSELSCMTLLQSGCRCVTGPLNHNS